MRRILWVAVLAVALSLFAVPFAPAQASSGAVRTSAAQPAGIGVRLVLKDPNFAAAFTFGPKGALFFANRFSGVIRQRLKDGSKRTVFTVTNLSTDGEQGLLGIALDPNWPSANFLYAYATRDVGGLKNQILKITVVGGVGTSSTVIWTSQTTAGQYHDGGHILFGPDGKLYAQVGEAHDSANAQDLSTDAGKMLRMNSDGTAPGNNVLGGRLFTRGMRNGFGFAFDPVTHRMWETENGPECVDEINQLNNGDNGAWGPNENCSGDDPFDTNNSGPLPRTLPKAWYSPTIAPTGIVFCPANGCGLPGHAGHAFFGSFNDNKIREIKFTGNRLDIFAGWPKIALNLGSGILSMERHPVNHHLFFSTPNGIYELVAT
jgi:glucose/arabinose dehydrogenase